MKWAEALNKHCRCASLDATALARLFPDAMPKNMFSKVPVFVASAELRAMTDAVRVLDHSLRTPAFAEAALADAAAIARFDPGTPGVFFGYDFHLGADGPKLIEINTNAGGALLNVALGQAQHPLCPGISVPPGTGSAGFVAMFRAEWNHFAPGRPLRKIAIVDHDPTSQYLYAEFRLCQDAFTAAGIDAVIADPRELDLRGVDIVYNRLTDFYLDTHQALREAYLQRQVLVTPHPRAHALFGSKRNLVRLRDPALLRHLDEGARAVITRTVPPAEIVHAENGERLWQQRKTLFFKPAHGFGSKAAYRGDKLTKSTFQHILANDYIAQALVPPSERSVNVDGTATTLKLDLRAYAYEGLVQLFAARLYSGQTTNFRTPGGGFAPVLACEPQRSCECSGEISQQAHGGAIEA